jgi:hypothetical protein
MSSIPTASFSAISAILEKDILDIIPYQRYARSPLYKMFGGYEPTNDDQMSYKENRSIPAGTKGTSMSNNNLYFPIITGQTGGAGAMDSSLSVGYGTVPTLQGTVPLTRQFVAFTIGEDVLISPGTVKDTFALYIQQSINSSAMDMSRQLYSDGTGTIGTAAAAGSSTTAFVFASSLNNDIDYAEYVYGSANGGTMIQIGANAPVQVVAVTGKNSITLATAQTWSSGATVVKTSPNGTAGNIENVGLKGIIGSGTYAGISDPSWTSNVTTSFGSFTSNNGISALNTMWVKTTRVGNPSAVFVNGTLFASYGNNLVNKQQWLYNDPMYAGWPTLEIMGGNGKMVLDFAAPDDSIFIVSPESLYMAYLGNINWVKGDSGILNHIQGTANYEAIATMYEAAFCNVRGANAIISGVTA